MTEVPAMHFYAFTLRQGEPIPFYRRTFGSMDGVLRWVQRQKETSFFTVNCLPKQYWY